MVGYRLMVGRQILILDVEVRALVPEPIPWKVLSGSQPATILIGWKPCRYMSTLQGVGFYEDA